MSERTALYRLFDAVGALLYVGITNCPARRWEQHRTEKAWWGDVATRELTWLESRELARAFEIAAIGRERPRYNIAETPLHRVVSNTPPDPEDLHPIARRLAERLRAIAGVNDPLARCRVTTIVLGQISEANGVLSRRRQADVRSMRERGLSYRAIGDVIGVHFTRVKQIESGQRTGNSAR